MIKLIELDKDTVTLEMDKEDLIKLRLMMGRGKTLLENGGGSLSESETAILWNITAIKNIATRGMIIPEDAVAWVNKVAGRVSDDAKVMDERVDVPCVNSDCARRIMEKSSVDARDSETTVQKEGEWFNPNSEYLSDRAT